MALDKEEKEKLDATHALAKEIKTALVGIDGKGGLIDKVEDVCESHYKLKRYFWILVGILMGLGVLGGSLWEILHF
jgi:hypothetical protein